MHSRDHANSEYLFYMGVDRKGVQFIDNKHTHKYILSFIIMLVQIQQI